MMSAEEIKSLIEKGIPGARVEVVDEAGDGQHFSATVVSDTFSGLNRVQQHQRVYGALGEAIKTRIHALALTTRVS